MNQAFALLAILGGILLASRVGPGTSASSDQGAAPASGESGGGGGSTSVAAPAGGALGVLATASQILGRVQQAAGVYRTVQGLLPSPGVPADETLTISSVVGDPQLPFPDLPMSDLIQAAIDDLVSPVAPTIEPGMTIGVDVGAMPSAEAVEGLVSPAFDVGEEAAYALSQAFGEQVLSGVAESAISALVGPGAETLTPLVISQVAGEPILGGLLTAVDLMPATTAQLAATEGLSMLSPILSVVTPVLMFAGFAYGFYTSGVWRSSNWEEDIPRARQYFGWALDGDPSGGWGISSHFRGDAEMARATYWYPSAPGSPAEAASDIWRDIASGARSLPLGEPAEWWRRRAYQNLMFAYRLERGIVEGFGGAIGEHTSIPWPAQWIPLLEADMEEFLSAEVPQSIPTTAYSGDTGR